VDAYKHLRGALTGPPDPWVEERRTPLSAALSDMERNVGMLEVTVEPRVTGATVRIDEAPAEPLVNPLVVPLGRINVEIKAPGFDSALRMLTISPSQLNRASITLHREGAEPPPVAPTEPTPAGPSAPVVMAAAPPGAGADRGTATEYNPWWFVLAGGGALVAASAAIPWLAGGSELDKLKTDCPGGHCDRSVYDSHESKIHSLDTTSTVLLVTGSVVAAAGVTLGFATARARPVTVSGWAAPHSTGLAASGTF
jgi:hypothetical protein